MIWKSHWAQDARTLRIRIGLLPILLLTISFAYSQGGATYTGPGFTITDGGARVASSCSTVTVSGITAPNTVLAVSLNGVSHTWLGDLEVRVYPPGAAPPPSTAAPSGVITSPPDGRSCNLLGNYRFVDSAAQSLDAATVGCADATNVPSGNYRTSNYGGGTNPGALTLLSTTFGASRTAASSNGNWLVCAFDFATPDGGTVTSTSIEFVSPSAAMVSIGGRVRTANGFGIGNTMVTLTDSLGSSRTAITNPFGYYRFDSVEVGQTYLISAQSKLYTFEQPTVAHHVVDETGGIDFIANP